MGAQQRVFKAKINSTKSLRKIFKAMELIAASRIQKAVARVQAAGPYSEALTRAVASVATHSTVRHTLTTEREELKRSAVVVLGPDRGFAGAYASNLLRKSEELLTLLHGQGKDTELYTVGSKADQYFTFRERAIADRWAGFSEAPSADHSKEIAEALLASFLRGGDAGGVDEIFLVFTRFVNSVSREPVYVRLLPLEVVDAQGVPASTAQSPARTSGPFPLYEFEPSAEEVLDALLPLYVQSRIHDALLNASASEQAARQQAMKTATDNADELINTYTRLANTARQAEITQEITEIVGGADALASSGASE